MLHSDLFRSGRWHRTVDTFRLTLLSIEAPTTSSFTVRWRMSEVCTGQIEYGLTSALGSTTTAETSFSLSEHIQTPTGLQAGTTYYFRTKSTSQAGVTVYSSIQTTATAGAPTVTLRGPRAAPAVPSGNNVYTIPGSIASDGTGDVGGAISNWLNSLPDGSTALFTSAATEGFQHGVDTPVATYRIVASPGINVIRTGLTLWGYGVKILNEGSGTSGQQGDGVRFWQNGTLTVLGFQIAGVNNQAGTTTAHDRNKQSNHGVSIAYNSSVTVHDCWVHHTWGDGLFVAGWTQLYWPTSGPYEFAYNLIELIGRMGVTANQCNTGQFWIHHNIIRDTGMFAIDGEDQKGGDDRNDLLIEENDIGTFGWYATTDWGESAIAFVYDWGADPLPHMASVTMTVRNNTFTGGCATATFNLIGAGGGVKVIDGTNFAGSYQYDVYHDYVITGNDFSGIPSNQRTVSYWVAQHYTRNVTLTDNTNLGTMVNRYTTTGSTGVTVSGNS